MDNSMVNMGTIVINEVNSTSTKILNWVQGVDKNEIDLIGDAVIKELLVEMAFKIIPQDQDNFSEYSEAMRKLESRVESMEKVTADLKEGFNKVEGGSR